MRRVIVRRDRRFCQEQPGQEVSGGDVRVSDRYGRHVADFNGGNMKGSCTSSNPDFVYSTFEFSDSFPQLISGTWQDAPPIVQVCPSQDSLSQCWNWHCTRRVCRWFCDRRLHLSVEKTSDSFVTQAGQGDLQPAPKLPVGAPLFFNPSSTHTDSGH